MSTATIAEVRPLGSVKSDFAAALARRGFQARIKDATAFAPKKVAGIVASTVKFVHADTVFAWLIKMGLRFEEIVGSRVARVWGLTSHSGQASLRFTARTAYKVSKWTLRTAWRLVTWPLRQWSPTRRGVEAIEATAKKLTMPEHNPAIVPVSIGLGWVGTALSADRWYMRAANLVASAFIFVRLTRNFIPAGPWRMLAYAAETPFMFSKLANLFPNYTTSVWDRVAGTPAKAKVKTDAAEMATEVVDEATVVTHEAAVKAADAADAAVIALEEQKLQIEKDLQEQIDAQNAAATRMREKAEALAAAEKAGDITEDVQPQGGVAVMTREDEVITDIPEPQLGSEVVVPDAVIPPRAQDGKTKPSPTQVPHKGTPAGKGSGPSS